MKVRLEKYNPQRHDQQALAKLIFESDKQMNRLTYGKNTLDVIEKMLTIPESYFVPEFMQCAWVNDKLVGVVVTFPASQLEEVDQAAGSGFMQAMGYSPSLHECPYI